MELSVNYLKANFIKKLSMNLFIFRKVRDIIQEKFIKGREVTCAVFNDKQIIKTLPITEMYFLEADSIVLVMEEQGEICT